MYSFVWAAVKGRKLQPKKQGQAMIRPAPHHERCLIDTALGALLVRGADVYRGSIRADAYAVRRFERVVDAVLGAG